MPHRDGSQKLFDLPAAYNPAANDFSHLTGWVGSTSIDPLFQTVTTASNQNELLYCWGCHSNAQDGTLREVDKSDLVMEAFRKHGIDAHIAVGGDGSQGKRENEP